MRYLAMFGVIILLIVGKIILDTLIGWNVGGGAMPTVIYFLISFCIFCKIFKIGKDKNFSSEVSTSPTINYKLNNDHDVTELVGNTIDVHHKAVKQDDFLAHTKNEVVITDDIIDEFNELERQNRHAALLAKEDSEIGAKLRKRLAEWGVDQALDFAEIIMILKRLDAIEHKHRSGNNVNSIENTASGQSEEPGHQCIVRCPCCTQKLAVPCDKWLLVYCKKCGHRFEYKS